MRKRPNIELLKDEFINAATTNVEENIKTHTIIEETEEIDYNKYVSNLSWPIDKEIIAPSYAEGCSLKKPLTVNLNEKEWNTVDRHVKTLGVTKDKWVKRAIFKELFNDQLTAFKNKQ